MTFNGTEYMSRAVEIATCVGLFPSGKYQLFVRFDGAALHELSCGKKGRARRGTHAAQHIKRLFVNCNNLFCFSKCFTRCHIFFILRSVICVCYTYRIRDCTLSWYEHCGR